MDCGNYNIVLGSLICPEKQCFIFFLLVFRFQVTTIVQSVLWHYSSLHLGTKVPLEDTDKTILDTEEKEGVRNNIKQL